MSSAAAPAHVYRANLTFLANAPSPTEIAAYAPPIEAQRRLKTLLERDKAGELTPAEQAELDEFERIEHLMVMLKAGALPSLGGAPRM